MQLPLRDFSEIVTSLKTLQGNASSSLEKRRSARMNVVTRIDSHLLEGDKITGSFSVLTRDISLTGIGLMQSVTLEPRREVILTLPRHTIPLHVVSVVLHCRSLADGVLAVGMEYVRIIDHATASHLIQEITEQRARLQRSILD